MTVIACVVDCWSNSKWEVNIKQHQQMKMHVWKLQFMCIRLSYFVRLHKKGTHIVDGHVAWWGHTQRSGVGCSRLN